jgi:hypothetical protein
MPDRAGVKMTWTNLGVIIFKVLFAVPRLIANRPSVVDPRVHEVRSLTRKASYAHRRALVTVHYENQVRKGL